MKLSVVIATKEEENNIRDCLESVKWADEIVVVDDASTDRTVEICREFTDKIFMNDSKGSFHKNKNPGIERAKGDWILSLDTDERITGTLLEEINVAIHDEKKVGYYISRNYFLMHGYKDDFRGFFISISSALTIFMTYAKLWETQQKD
jgi:glycosyltransferase involved in cell wall biosynthesis